MLLQVTGYLASSTMACAEFPKTTLKDLGFEFNGKFYGKIGNQQKARLQQHKEAFDFSHTLNCQQSTHKQRLKIINHVDFIRLSVLLTLGSNSMNKH